MLDMYFGTSQTMKRLPFFLWNIGVMLVLIVLVMILSSFKGLINFDSIFSFIFFSSIYVLMQAPLFIMRLNSARMPHSLYWHSTLMYYLGQILEHIGKNVLHQTVIKVTGSTLSLIGGVSCLCLFIFLCIIRRK